jgi:hypothetical protein
MEKKENYRINHIIPRIIEKIISKDTYLVKERCGEISYSEL